MTFCFVTNRISPHELPLATALAGRLDNGTFHYIVTDATNADRRNLGWETIIPAWCRITASDDAERRAAWQTIEQADVAFFGNRSHPLLERRLALGRLTILGTERWFKPPTGPLRLLHPGYLGLVCRCRRWLAHPAFQFLAQGIYAARDMRRIGIGLDPAIRLFGYLVAPSDPVPAPRHRSGPLQVLWVGRMLNWKRVDKLIHAVGRLTRAGRPVQLTLVGHGPDEPHLRRLAEKINAEAQRRGDDINAETQSRRGEGNDQDTSPRLCASALNSSPAHHSPLTTHYSPTISFHPPIPITEVRALMRQADVYVLPSSGMEGWGVVVNEAMLEGCAVIASRESGSGATLIRDGENGLLVPSGDVRALTRALELLEADESLRLRLAIAGQATMLAEWTPSIAAERLLAFCEARLAGSETSSWKSGPMSVSG